MHVIMLYNVIISMCVHVCVCVCVCAHVGGGGHKSSQKQQVSNQQAGLLTDWKWGDREEQWQVSLEYCNQFLSARLNADCRYLCRFAGERESRRMREQRGRIAGESFGDLKVQ